MKIIRLAALIIVCTFVAKMAYAEMPKPTIYLMPGLGTDYRIFSKLEFDSGYAVKHILFEMPPENSSMEDYARQLSTQIDTTSPFILIGASLGGMLATEMADFLTPEKVILIASAKCRDELPHRYKFQKILPIHTIIPASWIKKSTFILQPIVEPDRNKEKETFINMLEDKDPVFMSRATTMILEWTRTSYDQNIVHIHGESDRTLPIRNVTCDHIIPKGSHVMMLTRSDEIGALINEILAE